MKKSKRAKNMITKTSLKETFIKGSKIPISYLFDYIKEGLTISDFLSSYPWIKKKDVIKVLENLKEEKLSSRYVL